MYESVHFSEEACVLAALPPPAAAADAFS